MSLNYILVTGSSSGIGKQIAIQLSQNNNVILHGRDAIRLEEVKQLCNKSTKQLVWQNDLNITQDVVASLSQFILDNNIEISKYVHCAGYMKLAPLKMSTLDVLNATFNTNVIATSLIFKVLTQKKSEQCSFKFGSIYF